MITMMKKTWIKINNNIMIKTNFIKKKIMNNMKRFKKIITKV